MLKIVLADKPMDDLMIALMAWAISAVIFIKPARCMLLVAAKNGVRKLAENMFLGRWSMVRDNRVRILVVVHDVTCRPEISATGNVGG